ncbi:unnamed protein product [Linum trigynum]|uniref:Uncharacterized protein n=1 Tax=Linum trigynum TaxID=586398 RepID=A0AAV2ED37_9ROSI
MNARWRRRRVLHYPSNWDAHDHLLMPTCNVEGHFLFHLIFHHSSLYTAQDGLQAPLQQRVSSMANSLSLRYLLVIKLEIHSVHLE